MIKLRRLDSPSEAVRTLYHSAFPAEERRPWNKFTEVASRDPRFSINAVIGSDGEEAGFITSWDFGSFLYIEHFAVDPSRRGSGIGALALRSFVDSCGGRPVVLEVEPPTPDEPMTLRRIGFYSRNGFTLHDDFAYIQPPYSPELPEVELRLMTSGPALPDLREIATTLHSEVYGKHRPTRGPLGMIAIAIATSAALLTSGCGSDSASGRLTAVAVNGPVASVTSAVAGDNWDVVTLLPPGTNPENFDPSAAAIRRVADADLVVISGIAEAERMMMERVAGSQRPEAIEVDVAEGIDLIHNSHGGTTPDPHLWTSPLNLATMARNIAAALSKADPAGKPHYDARADSLVAESQKLMTGIETELESKQPARTFVVGHPSLSYFARDFRLRQIALGEEHKEQSVKAMSEAIDSAKKSGAEVMIVESETDSARMAAIAAPAGLKIAIVPTNGSDPVAAIRAAAAAITASSTD